MCDPAQTPACLSFLSLIARPLFSSPLLPLQAWVANYEKPRMNANSLLASPTGLSPYLRFGCLSCRLFYYRLWELYEKVRTVGEGWERRRQHPHPKSLLMDGTVSRCETTFSLSWVVGAKAVDPGGAYLGVSLDPEWVLGHTHLSWQETAVPLMLPDCGYESSAGYLGEPNG